MTARVVSCSALATAALAIVLAAAPAAAQWRRLSEGQEFSDVWPFELEVSPDGRFVVYCQDALVDSRFDIWSVALPAGSPVKLNGALPVSRSLSSPRFHISPDSSRVVYRVPRLSDFVHELYSVPIAGPASASVKLNGALADGRSVDRDYQISPDGGRVVYLADQDTDDVFELYSVPITGPASAGVKLNRPLVAGGEIPAFSFQISPNGGRVVYRADQDTDNVFELYSVPITGPASGGVKLNRPLVAGGTVFFVFEVSATGARVVYLADQEADGVVELYSVPIAGPASSGVKLNGSLVPGGQVLSSQISPDGGRVVYRAIQDDSDVAELYSVPITGPSSAAVKLNGPLVVGRRIHSYGVSPNSAWVVYRADQETDEVFELYSVPIAGPASAGVKLNGPLVANGEIQAVAMSPDSTWAVYVADQEIVGWPMGYRAPLAGPAGAAERIWATAVLESPNFAILPDSSEVVVQGSHAFVDSVARLWGYPLAGTPDWEGTDWLGGELQPDGDVELFRLLPDGSGAVYVADQEVDEQREAYLLHLPLWRDGFETGDTSRWSDSVP